MGHNSKKKKSWLYISIVVLALAIGCVIYINDYYRALPGALEVLSSPPEGVTVFEEKNKQIVFLPEEVKAGLIFYPGGKVQYEAYAPLMAELAEEGILCVLLKMPGNLAVLDMNAAEGVTELFPEVAGWYIGGHSLGGSMAASYLEKHTDALDGLVLLASYSTENLTDNHVEVVSVYGSEDEVLNAEKYESYRKNLPENIVEVVIGGGNHAGFGMYGIQDGDGKAAISSEEQIRQTVDVIVEAVLGSR